MSAPTAGPDAELIRLCDSIVAINAEERAIRGWHTNNSGPSWKRVPPSWWHMLPSWKRSGRNVERPAAWTT
jgi:hypothetical protein